MNQPSTLGWAIIGAAWLLCAFGSGALLAAFQRRVYPGLAFYKLWALWTTVLSVVAGAVFVLG